MSDPRISDQVQQAERQTLSGWGRSQWATMHVETPRDRAGLSRVLDPSVLGPDEAASSGAAPSTPPLLARGLGRSYGDAAQISGGTAVSLDRFKTMQWVDRSAGVLRVGAGVTIAELINRYVDQGWFVPVTPGTRNVTVGGAIAADIHGKNHHREGSWCDFVDQMTIMVASGDVVVASRDRNPGLFWATCGGMGLTGIVMEARVRMLPIASSRVVVETRRTQTLDELMDIMIERDDQNRFSVAWVDIMHSSCRGVLTLGDFAEEGALARPGTPAGSLPGTLLPNMIHAPTVKAFNEVWFRRAPRTPTITDESITGFFHPLDAVTNWNRVYGRAGFVQWQIALPEGTQDVLRSITDQLYSAGVPSFLSVLKRFGPSNPAPLSFPMAGWTLAVDVPAGRESTNQLLDRLDRQTADAGGRVYLAKDIRLDPTLLPRMYPRLDEWRQARDAWDPNRRFDSDLARRLQL